MQRWESYADWLNKLQRLGYHTREMKLNSQNYSVAQSRRRLFVVGDLKKVPEPLKTAPTKRASVRTILIRGSDNGYSYRLTPLFGNGRAEPTLARARRAIQALGPDKPFLIVYYGSDAAGGWQKLDRPLRTITTLDRFALVRQARQGHGMDLSDRGVPAHAAKNRKVIAHR